MAFLRAGFGLPFLYLNERLVCVGFSMLAFRIRPALYVSRRREGSPFRMHVAAWPGLSQSHFLLLGQVAAPVLGQEEPHTAEKALGILPGRAEPAKEK